MTQIIYANRKYVSTPHGGLATLRICDLPFNEIKLVSTPHGGLATNKYEALQNIKSEAVSTPHGGLATSPHTCGEMKSLSWFQLHTVD